MGAQSYVMLAGDLQIAAVSSSGWFVTNTRVFRGGRVGKAALTEAVDGPPVFSAAHASPA